MRVNSIDLLRAIAAISVVLCHYGQDLLNYPILQRVLSFGQYGVHIFFFISAYVITLSLKKNEYQTRYFLNFLFKRSLRIDPPYWIIILLTLVFYQALQYIPSYHGKIINFDIKELLSNMFYLVPFTNYSFYSHIFWTLCIEFQFYLFMGLSFYLINHFKSGIILLSFIPFVSFIHFENQYYFLSHYSCIFSSGMALFYYVDNNKKGRFYLIPFIISITVSFIIFNFPVAVVLLLSSLTIIYIKNPNRIFVKLGLLSYSIYLIHPNLQIIFKGLKNRIVLIQSYEISYLFFAICLTILLAQLFFVCIEQPSISLSKKFKLDK